MTCVTPQRETPSREFQPYTFDNVDQVGTVVAEIDPDRRAIVIVSTVATGGANLWVVTDTSGPKASTNKRWDLAPGEGIKISTAAKVVVRASTATAGSCKVMVERGSVT